MAERSKKRKLEDDDQTGITHGTGIHRQLDKAQSRAELSPASYHASDIAVYWTVL